MAPEYALWGYLTYKADVYSFGIVALEIVTGKHNMSHGPEGNFACLLDWVSHKMCIHLELLLLLEFNLSLYGNLCIPGLSPAAKREPDGASG